MNIGRPPVRIIERSNADKAQRIASSSVIAPDSNAATGTSRDDLALAAARWRIDQFHLTLQQLDTISFDHGIERESAAGFALAPAAMAAMRKQWLCGHAVAHRATGASAFEGEDFIGVHRRLSIGLREDLATLPATLPQLRCYTERGAKAGRSPGLRSILSTSARCPSSARII